MTQQALLNPKSNLDMAVGGDPLGLDGALHFVDLHLEAVLAKK